MIPRDDTHRSGHVTCLFLEVGHQSQDDYLSPESGAYVVPDVLCKLENLDAWSILPIFAVVDGTETVVKLVVASDDAGVHVSLDLAAQNIITLSQIQARQRQGCQICQSDWLAGGVREAVDWQVARSRCADNHDVWERCKSVETTRAGDFMKFGVGLWGGCDSPCPAVALDAVNQDYVYG